jgi:hypothetical protein
MYEKSLDFKSNCYTDPPERRQKSFEHKVLFFKGGRVES